MWRSISSATTTRARDGSATLACCTRGIGGMPARCWSSSIARSCRSIRCDADRPRGRLVPMTTFFVAVLLTSVGAGTVGAVLGLGGGILLVPILTIFFGVDLHYAMGASIISVIATSSGAAAAYLRTGLSNVRIGFFLVMATIAGALTGALLMNVVPVRVLQLLLGLALAYSTVTTLRQLRVELPEPAEADALALRFGLEGTYYDAALDRDVKYRATR